MASREMAPKKPSRLNIACLSDIINFRKDFATLENVSVSVIFGDRVKTSLVSLLILSFVICKE